MRFIHTEQKPARLTLKRVMGLQGKIVWACRKEGVELLFIHGSLAKDAMRALSDVDIAVQLKKPYASRNISNLIERLQQVLGREDIDLGVLNTGSPLFCMQVLRNGRFIYGNHAALNRFRLHTIQRYLATAHLRNSFHVAMEKSILRDAP